MSTGSALVRVLAVSALAAGTPLAAFDTSSPVISTGDAVATAPGGSVQNTGGNITIGTPSDLPSAGPNVLAAPAAPNLAAPVHTVSPSASAGDAAVARAHQLADEATQRAWAEVDAARQHAADVVANAQRMAADAAAEAHSQADSAAAASSSDTDD